MQILGGRRFKENVRARGSGGMFPQGSLGFHILWDWFWHDLRGQNDISGTILYAFVSNCVNDMYIHRYDYGIAAALSDTKGTGFSTILSPGDRSQSCTDHSHWTQSNSIRAAFKIRGVFIYACSSISHNGTIDRWVQWGLGVGSIGKYSTSVFLGKILRYYYIPTIGVAD